MDTVTEARFGYVIAQEGGIGIAQEPTAQEQAAHGWPRSQLRVRRCCDLVVITPEHTVAVLQLSEQLGIRAFLVCDGSGKVVGIVTGRDLRFEPATTSRSTRS